MADFPYTSNTASIKQLFSKIHEVGKPTKVTQKWLESIGFKSKSDRRLIPMLKTLAFIDGSSALTDRWSAYRNKT